MHPPRLKRSMLIAILLIICCVSRTSAKISEKKLSNYKSLFVSMVIEQNPGYEQKIRRFLNGMVMEGRRGIRLEDKFGLFLDNMDKKGVDIDRVRFYGGDSGFCLFLVMADRNDGQLYTMFVEYEYGSEGRCELRNIYFSIVFEERMNEVKDYFKTR